VFADFVWVQNVIFPLIGMAMGGFVLYGIYRTANRLIDRRDTRHLAEGGELAEQVRELQDRLTIVEDQAGRVEELEQRIDFAERLLVEHRSNALPGDT
jgi:hypothetical protein